MIGIYEIGSRFMWVLLSEAVDLVFTLGIDCDRLTLWANCA